MVWIVQNRGLNEIWSKFWKQRLHCFYLMLFLCEASCEIIKITSIISLLLISFSLLLALFFFFILRLRSFCRSLLPPLALSKIKKMEVGTWINSRPKNKIKKRGRERDQEASSRRIKPWEEESKGKRETGLMRKKIKEARGKRKEPYTHSPLSPLVMFVDCISNSPVCLHMRSGILLASTICEFTDSTLITTSVLATENVTWCLMFNARCSMLYAATWCSALYAWFRSSLNSRYSMLYARCKETRKK